MKNKLTDEEFAQWQKNTLSAWNEWKEICFVLGCEQDNQLLLAKGIIKAYQRKFQAIFKHNFTKIIPEFIKFTHNEKINDDIRKWQFWVDHFDNYLVAKITAEQNSKDYKNYIWNKIAESNDPPLKLISGKLLGEKGLINAIAEKYLKENHVDLWENLKEYNNNKRRVRKIDTAPIQFISKDENIDEEGNNIYADIIGQEDKHFIFGYNDTEICNKLSETFENKEILLFIAEKFNMLSSPATESYFNLKKTAITNMWNNQVYRKMQKEMPIIFSMGTYEKIFICMKKVLSAEKSAEPFLLELDRRWQKKLQKEQAKDEERVSK